eukprot:6213001-Pleurochrysis_carterae.AAC.3
MRQATPQICLLGKQDANILDADHGHHMKMQNMMHPARNCRSAKKIICISMLDSINRALFHPLLYGISMPDLIDRARCFAPYETYTKLTTGFAGIRKISSGSIGAISTRHRRSEAHARRYHGPDIRSDRASGDCLLLPSAPST